METVLHPLVAAACVAEIITAVLHILVFVQRYKRPTGVNSL